VLLRRRRKGFDQSGVNEIGFGAHKSKGEWPLAVDSYSTNKEGKMGIDISGGMLVGESGSNFEIPDEIEDVREWADENGMEVMCEYFDADFEDSYFGFEVEEVLVSEINDSWIAKINELADKFERLTGLKARLIGTQDIY
jgi:hypothetical protein